MAEFPGYPTAKMAVPSRNKGMVFQFAVGPSSAAAESKCSQVGLKLAPRLGATSGRTLYCMPRNEAHCGCVKELFTHIVQLRCRLSKHAHTPKPFRVQSPSVPHAFPRTASALAVSSLRRRLPFVLWLVAAWQARRARGESSQRGAPRRSPQGAVLLSPAAPSVAVLG